MTRHQLYIENIKIFFKTIFRKYNKEDRKEIKKNKKLVKEFPFLFPTIRYSNKPMPKYDYTWTELDNLEEGWQSFGIEMCQRLKENLVKANYLYKYQITHIKEKFGTLRWYDNGVPKSIEEEHQKIIEYYEDKSMLVCILCGKETKYVTSGWTNYFCEEGLRELQSKSPDVEYQELVWTHIPVRTKYHNGNPRREDSQLKGEMMVAWKRYSKYNNLTTNDTILENDEEIVKLW